MKGAIYQRISKGWLVEVSGISRRTGAGRGKLAGHTGRGVSY
jgi:hypothetical protein